MRLTILDRWRPSHFRGKVALAALAGFVALLVSIGLLYTRPDIAVGDAYLPVHARGLRATIVPVGWEIEATDAEGKGAPPPAQPSCLRVTRPDDLKGGQEVCDGETFTLDGLRLRVSRSRNGARLALVGATLDRGVIGAAISSDRILRFPGAGNRHLELLRPEEPGCDGDFRCVRALVPYDRTRIQRSKEAPPIPLEQNQIVPVSPGDLIWLGLVPLEVREGGEGIVLEAPAHYQHFGGDRRWIRDPTPVWPLSGAPPWTLFGEAEELRRGHVRSSRIERQMEEEIQALIDAEMLCLKPGIPGTEDPPRVVWRSTSHDECALDRAPLPLTRQQQYLQGQYRYSKTLIRLIDQANRLLEDGAHALAPELLNFTFDWTYAAPEKTGIESVDEDDPPVWMANVSSQLVPVPTRLLGMWWGKLYREVPVAAGARGQARPQRALDGAPVASIHMRRGTTSPQLRVTRGHGALRPTDLLLLGGAWPAIQVTLPMIAGSDETGAPTAELLGSLCISEDLLDGTRFGHPDPADATARGFRASQTLYYGGAIPLGRLSLAARNPDIFALAPLSAPEIPGCFHVARDSSGGFWVAGDTQEIPSGLETTEEPNVTSETDAGSLESGGASIRDVEDGTAPSSSAPSGRGMDWREVKPGTRLAYHELEFVFRYSGDLAAVSTLDQDGYLSKRVYPFEQDAGQLIGRGPRHASGLEAALEDEVLEAGLEGGIELTVHGDLQRIVNRALSASMRQDLRGKARGDEHLASRRGTAVLLDSETGAVLAAATWPPFDPNLDPRASAALYAARRRQGVTFDTAENWAFVRDRAAGSTYKLATSIALARAGFLNSVAAADATPVRACQRGLQIYEWRDGRVWPRYEPTRSPPEKWRHFRCSANHKVLPVTPGVYESAFVRAFARSCNVFFGLASMSLLGNGMPFGGAVDIRELDPSRPDLGLESDGHMLFEGRSRDGTLSLGYLWPRFVPSSVVPILDERGRTSGNRMWRTLMELGHRFYYLDRSGRRITQQRDRLWAPGHEYPSVAHPWLPGIRPGQGFRYPEIAGPAAIGGPSSWPDGVSPDPTWLEGRFAHVEADRGLKTVAVTGWGQEMAASALSLAVLAAVPGSFDGRLVAPWIVRTGADPAGQVVETGYLSNGRGLIRTAMRRVLRGPGRGYDNYNGTGYGYFSGLGRERSRTVASLVGGKTGTIQRSIPALTATIRQAQLRRVRMHACGVAGVRVDPARDWKKLFGEVSDTVPPAGFAAHIGLCNDLVPGRVPVRHATVPDGEMTARESSAEDAQEEVASQWLARYKELTQRRKTVTVNSSAFVAAVLEPLSSVDPPHLEGVSETLRTGSGLALAVVCDNEERAGKHAAAAILSDLKAYFDVRGSAAPRMAQAHQRARASTE